ncbi:MAG: phage holin family protein [Janthinobacterium lividum]
MLKFLIKFVLTAVLTYGLAQILPNVHLNGVSSAAVLVIVLGILNATVKPILKLLGFPLTVVTLGFFLLVINVIIVKLADYLLAGFEVVGLINALIFSIALSLVTTVVDMVVD